MSSSGNSVQQQPDDQQPLCNPHQPGNVRQPEAYRQHPVINPYTAGVNACQYQLTRGTLHTYGSIPSKHPLQLLSATQSLQHKFCHTLPGCATPTMYETFASYQSLVLNIIQVLLACVIIVANALAIYMDAVIAELGYGFWCSVWVSKYRATYL